MNKAKKENIQIYPAKKRLVPNFKLCKVTSNLSREQYEVTRC